MLSFSKKLRKIDSSEALSMGSIPSVLDLKAFLIFSLSPEKQIQNLSSGTFSLVHTTIEIFLKMSWKKSGLIVSTIVVMYELSCANSEI